MKKILLVTMLFASSVFASKSQWQLLGGHTPILYSQIKDSNILLMIGDRKNISVSLMDLRGDVEPGSCSENETRGAEEIAPIVINQKQIKFVQFCIAGTGIMQPKTDEGKNYLDNEVLSGKPVQIIFGNGYMLGFPASDINALKKRIQEQDAAE